MVEWPWVPFACSTAGLQLLPWRRFFIVSPFTFTTCTGLRWKVTFIEWLCLSYAIKKNGVKSSEVRERYSKQRSKSRKRVIVGKQRDCMCHPETDGTGSQQVKRRTPHGTCAWSFKEWGALEEFQVDKWWSEAWPYVHFEIADYCWTNEWGLKWGFWSNTTWNDHWDEGLEIRPIQV